MRTKNTKQRLRAEDDDDAFENGVLKDGARYVVPMRAMDSLQRDVARHYGRVVDSDGGPLDRPGFTVAAVRDDRRAIYDAYDAAIRREYANPPTGVGSHGPVGARVGDLCTIDGSPGHLKVVHGGLKCVPDKRSADATQDLTELYRQRDQETANEWRRNPK